MPKTKGLWLPAPIVELLPCRLDCSHSTPAVINTKLFALYRAVCTHAPVKPKCSLEGPLLRLGSLQTLKFWRTLTYRCVLMLGQPEVLEILKCCLLVVIENDLAGLLYKYLKFLRQLTEGCASTHGI